MTELPRAIHDTITAERQFRAAPAAVYKVFTDPALRSKLEPAPEGFEMVYDQINFTVGGIENGEMRQHGQTLATFEHRYLEIVPDRRYLFTVKVIANGQIMSCSKNTIEFLPQDGGTLCVCTEHVSWLHGASMRTDHEGGWNGLLENAAGLLSE